MFPADDPAPDIAALIAILREQHRDGDLYRGQVKDYPALVPSTYRRAVVAGSEHDAIVRIDTARFYAALAADSRSSQRYDLMCRLIEMFGIALGNLIAQQYGVSSECVDVSEDIATAAFFATRRWPEYAHASTNGFGVIYRFRRGDADLHPSASSDRHLLDTLSNWFEMGRGEDGVCFDFFVREDEKSHVFDRDSWWRWMPAKDALVSTLPISIRWADLHAAVARGVPSSFPRDPENPHRERTARDVFTMDWRRSRVAGQAGGFIRPSIVWRSDVPAVMRVDRNASDMRRAVPSAAIKRELIGIENIRRRNTCDTFFFRHGDARVTGIYRRTLWPEPSEDPLYGLVWHLAAIELVRTYFNADSMPAVDDPDAGLLDRGYRVTGERRTHDARELDDLARGELEDAREALVSGGTATDYARAATALSSIGEYGEALHLAISGLRLAPADMNLLLAVAALLRQRGKDRWANGLLDNAASMYPNAPEVLAAQAVVDLTCRRYAAAAVLLDRVLAQFDPFLHKLIEYELVADRALVAAMLGDDATFETMVARYERLTLDEGGLREYIARRRMGG